MLLFRFLADLSFVVVLIALSLFFGWVITQIVLSPAEKKVYHEPKQIEVKEDFIEFKEQPIKPRKIESDIFFIPSDSGVIIDHTNNSVTTTEPGWSSIDIYILCVITAEGGHDQDTCNYVAQALYNACVKYNWKYPPFEMVDRYKYAKPLTWYSAEAERAYRNIFFNGVRYPEVGNATIFYAPEYCRSEYHESQILVLDHHGVKYFEERN